MQTDGFQTFLARRLTAYLSSEIGNRITIGKVSIRFFQSAVLKEVMVEDLHGDTLFSFQEVGVSLNDLSTKKKVLDISTLTLRNGSFHLIHAKGEAHDNLHYFLDYFSSSDTADTVSSPWKITASSLELKDCSFLYDDFNEPAEPFGVDFSHVAVRSVNGDLHDIHFINDSIFARIDRLRFTERSGLEVREFSGDAKVSSQEIRVNKAHIRTPGTDLRGDLDFNYETFLDFDDFIDKVKWRGDFASSTVDFRDIALFATDLQGLDRTLRLQGRFKGNVRKFQGKDAILEWGKSSRFAGDIRVTGLPEIDDTHIDIRADELLTNTSDIEWIPLPPFTSGAKLSLPDNLDCMGQVRFQGHFNGFFSDFVAYGNAMTDIGYVTMNVNLKSEPSIDSYSYRGEVGTRNFDVGRLTETPHLGSISMQAYVKGSGFRIKDLTADMSGRIESVVYRDFAYRNIAVEGRIAKKLFNGSIDIREPEVDFSFGGTIDMRQEVPVFDFTADIRRLELQRLNFLALKEDYVLTTSVSSRLTGRTIDELSGTVSCTNSYLQAGSKMYFLHLLNLTASGIPSVKRRIELDSDILDADVNGQFELATLPQAFREIIPRYLPNVLLPVKGSSGRQKFDFNVLLKNTSVVTENFLPDLYFDPTTRFFGHVDDAEKTFDIHFDSPELHYGPVRWMNLKSVFTAQGDEMHANVTSDTVYYSGEGYVPGLKLLAAAHDNNASFDLSLSDFEASENSLRWNGNFFFRSYRDFSLHVDSSRIVIDRSFWELDADNRIDFDSLGIHFTDFSISKGDEFAGIHGSVSRDSLHVLSAEFRGFRLSLLDPALEAYKVSLNGTVEGTVEISGLYDDVRIESDLGVKDLAINGDTLGNAVIRTDYVNGRNDLQVDMYIEKGSAKVIAAKGRYRLRQKEDNLDFHLTTDNFYLHTLENLMEGVVTDVRGKVSCDLKLSGTFEKPVFEGYADFRKAAVTVDYLNTRYNFTSKVVIRENEFDLDGIKVMDENGHEAGVKGRITHRYFSDFRFDVEVYPRNFQVLNTTVIQNSLYYGRANATGYARFNGSIDDMEMDIALSPNKGSVLNIPLNTASEVTASDFITFVNMREVADFSENTNTVNLSGIRLNMNLDMTPDAEINIIFDEKIGDVISGNGNGNLRLDINQVGDFNMYGTFNIEKGTYLFTLQNLINKRFQINQGGRITWGGDPYDATVDMTAVYSVYTGSLVNLIQDSTFQRRVPVDCRLNLTGKLMNPSINYEIAVRAQDATIESMVRTVLNSEQEVSRQMFGLLVFNQFLPPSVSTSSVGRFDAGAGAVASASELLSNQVSNWLSQLSKDVNIGFNYRAKDTYSSEEINLMFSKTMFNDRLLVETNVGVMGNNATATNTNANNVVGEFYTEYKVSADGRFRLKAYNRSNADDLINFNAPYTQGAGVFFRQDFNSLKDLKERLGLTRNKEVKE
ncbi:MAG: hypothetical protein RL213_611 [Bacteroidota bacterium]